MPATKFLHDKRFQAIEVTSNENPAWPDLPSIHPSKLAFEFSCRYAMPSLLLLVLAHGNINCIREFALLLRLMSLTTQIVDRRLELNL